MKQPTRGGRGPHRSANTQRVDVISRYLSTWGQLREFWDVRGRPRPALAELLAGTRTDLDLKVLMLDSELLNECCVVVALATGAEGTKVPVGLWDSSTENKTFSSRRYWPTWSGAA